MEFATYKCSACGKEFNVIVGYSYGYNYSTRTHEAIARHNWTGCTDNEDWAATHLPLCEECRQKEAARIAKEAKKQGLPELKGKPDDVALGEMIRKDMLSFSDAAMDLLRTKEGRDSVTEWDEYFCAESVDYIDKALADIKSAAVGGWWVDVCDHFTVEYVAKFILSAADRMARAVDLAQNCEYPDENMCKATFFPAEQTKDVVFFDRFGDNVWVVYKERDDSFDEICREHRLSWKTPTMWLYSNANKEDLLKHVTELTAHLLRAGFSVRCFDKGFMDDLRSNLCARIRRQL